MGLINALIEALFGQGRNVVKETAEVFRINAEAEAGREHSLQEAALQQFAREFERAQASRFDRFMDGLNRVPRPAMALGTLALFVSAMVDPVWFAARMAGIALVPEPLWWLLAAVVSFYFGARHQAKGQEFQRDLARTMAAVPSVVRTVQEVEELRGHPRAPAADAGDWLRDAGAGTVALAKPDVADANPALDDWRAARGGQG